MVFFYGFAGLLALSLVCWWFIDRSRFGAGLKAIREDEDKAESLGVPTAAFKVVAYALSALFVAAAGGMYALWFGSLDPIFVFSILISSYLVLMSAARRGPVPVRTTAGRPDRRARPGVLPGRPRRDADPPRGDRAAPRAGRAPHAGRGHPDALKARPPAPRTRSLDQGGVRRGPAARPGSRGGVDGMTGSIGSSLVTQSLTKAYGGVIARERGERRDPRGQDQRPDRAQRLGKDDVLQPRHGDDQARLGIGVLSRSRHHGSRTAPHRPAGIGRTFQLCRTFPRMTALDNMLVAVRRERIRRAPGGAARTPARSSGHGTGSGGSASSTSSRRRRATCRTASRSCSSLPPCSWASQS